jgi:hypothetical protein
MRTFWRLLWLSATLSWCVASHEVVSAYGGGWDEGIAATIAFVLCVPIMFPAAWLFDVFYRDMLDSGRP